MKKSVLRHTYFALLLLVGGMFSSCEDSKEEDEPAAGKIEFQGNNAVIKAGDMSNLRVKNLPGTIELQESVPKGELWVRSSVKLDNYLAVKREGGEFRIESNNLPSAIDLVFLMNPLDIRKIVIEGKNKVLIASSPVLERLELVTEGESELTFRGLRVRHLTSRREGESRMDLSSGLPSFGKDSLYFPARTVRILPGGYLYYTDNQVEYLLVAQQVKVRNDSVFALAYTAGNPLRAFFVTQSHTLINQGETYLDALALPTINVTSKNEGKSQARVWAMDRLEVTGSGESRMYYIGNPAVTKNLSGSAFLGRL